MPPLRLPEILLVISGDSAFLSLIESELGRRHERLCILAVSGIAGARQQLGVRAPAVILLGERSRGCHRQRGTPGRIDASARIWRCGLCRSFRILPSSLETRLETIATLAVRMRETVRRLGEKVGRELVERHP